MAELSAIASEAIRAVVAMALAEGNAVETIAQWEKALVVHMKHPPGSALKARVQAEHPGLSYYRYEGDPHYPADHGFMDGQFGVSFPMKG